MLITDPALLAQFSAPHRIWQGIPSIEVTPRGRVFLTWYSGGTAEQIGNFALLAVSDDGGKTFAEPIAAAYADGHRCFDPCLWMDPLGRLWFTWNVSPDNGTYAAICNDPDGETLVWHAPRRIGGDVMMNKPTVLSDGRWMFPIAVWHESLGGTISTFNPAAKQRGAFACISGDQGETIRPLSVVDMPRRSFDEHMILEYRDGSLGMFVRTRYGIGRALSADGGASWGEPDDRWMAGPCSRFFIRRLRSGRLLLIHHVHFTGRNNLTAMLSDDEGQSWKWQLLLDGRADVSYPDAVEAADGSIWIVYDRDRGAFKKTLDEARACAREILTARITEEDIMRGELSPASWLGRVANKL